MPECYRIGCSGWSYDHWRGNFYPRELAQSKWLRHYAENFGTVELNGTFYRLPSETAVRRWRTEAPEGFCFSAKVSRLITHFRRLRDTDAALDKYFERIRLLSEKLGPLLYQLPPNLERDDKLIESFIERLPKGITHVFEFRHESWWTEDIWKLLRRHDAAFCVYQRGRSETPFEVTSPVFYMRFHGSTAASTGYGDETLKRWARRIREADAQEAWVYFNNDAFGRAPRDALRLRELIEHRRRDT